VTTYRAPHLDTTAWDSVILTGTNKQSVTLPPRPVCGNVKVSLSSKIKIDSKKAAGKSGATVTRQGAKDAAVTIELEFGSRYWPEVETALKAIDPRGPSLGGPFLLSCPNLPERFEAIQIEEVSPRGTAAIVRGLGKVKITGKECSFPKAGGFGGGSVKKKALTAAEKQALIVQIEGFKRVASIYAATAALTSGSEEGYATKNKEQEALFRKIAELQRQLDESNAQTDAPAAPTSETTTPAAPGNAIGRAVDQIGNALHDPKSFKPTSNPSAPVGGPTGL